MRSLEGSISEAHMITWARVTDTDGLAYDLRHHKGTWALSGDRIIGLTVQMGKLVESRITRGMLEFKVVWDIYLELVVKEGTSRKILKNP